MHSEFDLDQAHMSFLTICVSIFCAFWFILFVFLSLPKTQLLQFFYPIIKISFEISKFIGEYCSFQQLYML